MYTLYCVSFIRSGTRFLSRDERVPGLNLNESDVSYLAMDAEEGVEVVWNETYFSSLKKLNEQKDKIQKVSGQWQLLS